ncbi:amidohydrolase family protein [Robiginitalea sp. SC105]|uniref:N-acyl-D-amino-acid deacylase family protein n=1 Tax=Robiginitalea sp. SC105 TaxID=2762332 RepID=UPI00163B427E|nr:D-aminoacylase [Robiginitalea sp. SC105]MBC2839973.1 D-aminoacylase [Robiginitalea sp. SC105]
MRLSCLLFSLLLLGSCQQEPEFDVLIRNGQLLDGSGSPAVRADLGIRADTIAAIGDLSGASGKSEIDASGLYLAPGFINMLSWANVSLLEDGRSQSDIRQGVTLEVMGEGRSMGPLNEAMRRDMLEGQQDITYDIPWTTLGEYLQYLEDKGVSTNVASFVGNGTLREYVMGYEKRDPTPVELDSMKALLRRGMEEGAVGLSTSLIYVPSGHAKTREITELAKVVSGYGGMYVSHIRNEEDSLLYAVRELIQVAEDADVPAEIYHFKASGQDNWHLLDSAIALVEEARGRGLAITTDMYMYNASSTGLNVLLPAWAKDGGHEKTMEFLEDPAARSRMIREVKFHVPPENILLVGFRNEDLRHLIGRNLAEVAAERGIPPAEAVADLIHEDDSRIQVVYFSMSPENVEKKLALPYMAACSDAGSYTNEGVFLKQSTHPRAYGSFARLLGHYVRERGIISLEEAVRRLTSLPAGNLKLKKRGLLRPGYFADVVLFDPDRIEDTATFQEPHQYATGVEHVLVNGVAVLRSGEHTGAFPGRFVKGPGYSSKNP